MKSLFLCFLWSCYSNFLLFVSILLVMRNSSFLSELLRLFLWWHTYIKSTENSCIPYCYYGWNTTHTCSLSTPWAKQRKCRRRVRTCMQNLPRPKILPRFDHYLQLFLSSLFHIIQHADLVCLINSHFRKTCAVIQQQTQNKGNPKVFFATYIGLLKTISFIFLESLNVRYALLFICYYIAITKLARLVRERFLQVNKPKGNNIHM